MRFVASIFHRPLTVLPPSSRLPWLGLLLVGSTLIGLPADAADRTPATAEEVLAGLQAWLDETETLEARFEQEILSGALGIGEAERGSLTVVRPGRMRWDYREPEVKVAIVDAGLTWFYVEADQQLLRGRLEETGDLLPVLLAGTEPLDRVFTASLRATPDLGGDGNYHLVLRPRRNSEDLENLVVIVHPRTWAIEGAQIRDAGGNTLALRLGIRHRNREVDPSVFGFEVPPGTEVIGSVDTP